MSDCIFCQIVSGAERASVIYEDEIFIAFMDAFPLTKGHCLVVPKRHCVRLDELNAKNRAQLFNIGNKIVEAQKKAGLGVMGTNLLINDGKAANQTIPHLHLHLIPRESEALTRSIPKLFLQLGNRLFGFKTSRDTLDEHAQQIRQHLS